MLLKVELFEVANSLLFLALVLAAALLSIAVQDILGEEHADTRWR
jgi:hypothetical protein